MNAARQEISRTQLAKWDASARSWLLTADEATIAKHKQLQLILKNVNIPVNASKDPYGSVMAAWRSSMTTLECLIKGMPQSIKDGAVLLGLSSWHIYPDLVVLGDHVTSVEFKDSLVATGGVLTIGLHRSATEDQGISWSLSLAHLRFYGEPVTSSRSSSNDTSRVTFDELGVAVLGSVVAGWGFEDVRDIEDAADWFTALWTYLSRYVEDNDDSIPKEKVVLSEQQKYLEEQLKILKETDKRTQPQQQDYEAKRKDLEICKAGQNRLQNHEALSELVKQVITCPSSWLEFLARCSTNLLESEGLEREHFVRLARFGQRRGRIFLGEKNSHPPPVFGLLRPSNHMLFISEEQRIQLLRRIAHECGLDQLPPGDVVIKYRRRDCPALMPPDHLYEFATAVPCKGFLKNEADTHEAVVLRHARFIGFPKCFCPGVCNTKSCACRLSGVDCTKKCHRNITEQRKCGRFGERLESARGGYWHTEHDKRRHTTIVKLGEDCCSISDTGFSIFSTDPEVFVWIYPPKEYSASDTTGLREDAKFRFLLGNRKLGAIYIRDDKPSRGSEQAKDAITWRLPLKELTRTLKSNYFDQIDPPKLATWISERGPHPNTQPAQGDPMTYFPSLMILMGAERVYSQLANATVSLGVMSSSLHTAPWAPQKLANFQGKWTLPLPQYQGYKLNRSQAFACIAMFDSGTARVDPSTLHRVMAMSSGNSIYVATPLLADPFSQYGGHEIKRIIGNIGRPGIAMLVPPQSPRLRRSDGESSWKLVNHNEFDGKKENCFGATSMHLSFTGYEAPVSLDSQGLQDVEVYLVESVISVHERGEWVADLDVLGMLEQSKMLKRYEKRTSCSHSCSSRSGYNRDIIRLTAIDNWDELLDSPLGAGIVRANANWTARLATTVAALQKGHPVCIINGDACWECMRDNRIFGKDIRKGRLQPDILPHIFIY
jgi:hypothetical protein